MQMGNVMQQNAAMVEDVAAAIAESLEE